MSKRICGLMIILAVFCGIFASSPAAYAMNKTDKTTIEEPGVITLHSVAAKRDGDKLSIQWEFTTRLQSRSLEGTKVKINLYQNGQFLRTIAENVSIGQNSRGSYSASWDWGNKNAFVKGKEYTIEIVSMANPNVRTVSGKMTCEEDCGKVIMPGAINE